jgi:hypothetical protein
LIARRQGDSIVLVQGSTRLTLIIGHPIAQVSSPALFNRRFEDLCLDSVMIPADIAPEQLTHFLSVLRGWDNADGCVVTIPHKRAVVAQWMSSRTAPGCCRPSTSSGACRMAGWPATMLMASVS